MADKNLIDALNDYFTNTQATIDNLKNTLATLNPVEEPPIDIDPIPDPEPLPPIKGDGVGPWGKGPKSGLPWYSGACINDLAGIINWEKVARPTRPCDILQLFAPRKSLQKWDDIAGGQGDDPSKLEGQLSFTNTKSRRPALTIWKEVPTIPCVYTMWIIPAESGNQGGKNPQVWFDLANGKYNDVYRRLGRRFAYLDGKYPREKLIIEIAHEFTGGWYEHSVYGVVNKVPAWQKFGTAYDRIVENIRKGYFEVARKNCPYLFWVRPARSTIDKGIWLDSHLPSLESFDGIGLSQHDNLASSCTPENPRINWTRQKESFEGLVNIAEMAKKWGKYIGFFEWSSHHPDAGWSSGKRPDLFTRSMWDFFNQYSDNLLGDTYFLSSETQMIGKADWAGTTEYQKTFGNKK